MLGIRRSNAGCHGPDRPVLSHDFRKIPRPNFIHDGACELYPVQGFQFFHFVPALGGLGVRGLFVDDFLPDFIDVFLVALLQPVRNLFLQLPFHSLPGQHIRQLVLQFSKDSGNFLIQRYPRVVPAFQDEPFHAHKPDLWVLVMYIFQCIIPAGLDYDLF